ncbi:LemA family protein [Nonlabens dokdonensis]|nr:LemA family protein [Nonlabens dokdonensis]
MKNYLDLKSFENMIQLQRTLRVMEEQINSAIRAYNSNVLVLNDKIVSISTIVLAAYLEYQPAICFEARESENSDPNVSFLFR